MAIGAREPRRRMEGEIRTVAVIDDDPDVLDSLRLMLEVAGYRVAAYGSARAFLADRASGMACLILDHHMPEMTGLDLVVRLRTEGVCVPVLLITGRSSPALLARAAELDVAKVLEKPLHEGELLCFVANIGAS